MANNKLSWTELRRALAARAGVSEKEANLFLNALNAQLIEALKQDIAAPTAYLTRGKNIVEEAPEKK